jgi:putative ABC transport system permease protein
MTRVTARGLWSRKRRLSGLLAAVFLGVAFLTGTLGLSATMSSAISSAFTTAYRGTGALVRNATVTTGASGQVRGPISAAVTGAVRAAPGVAAASGEVLGFGEVAGADGQVITGNGPRTAGTWITDQALNPWHLAAGAPPRGSGQVVIDQATAANGDLHVGQRTTVYTPGPASVTISGIAVYGSGQASDGGAGYVAFTLPGAQQHLLGGAGQVSQVVAAATPGVTQAQLVRAISRVIPAGTQVITGQQATGEQVSAVDSEFLNFFKAFLGVFAGIALLVAALSVHNTFGVVAAQRVREAALLRALGAARSQIMRGLLAEAALLGLVGSAAGIAAGYGMAAGLKGAFAGVGLDLPIGGVVFTAGNALLGLAVGVAVTVLAALAPALRAARTAPVAALRDADADPAGASRTRRIAGPVLAAGGAALTIAAAMARGPAALVGVGAVVTLAGVLVLGPVLAVLAARLLGAPVAGLRGAAGRLARRNTARAPKRTASAAAALTVGVAIVTLFTVFGASLKASARASLDQAFTGNLVVSAAGPGYGTSGFSPRVAARIAAQPGVRAAAATGPGTVLLDGKSARVTVADPAALGKVFTLSAVSGDMAVSTTAAKAHGWHAGSSVRVTFADGSMVPMTIGSLYRPVTPLGDYVLPVTAWAAHTAQMVDHDVYVAFSPGADAAGLTARIAGIGRQYGGLTVQDRAAYLAAESSMVDTVLDIVYVMLALAIVIALLGIANTLSLAVHERTREIGLLRAVGASRRQVRAIIRWEGVLTAVLGTSAGAALGLFLGWALVTAVATAAQIGVVAVPWPQLGVVLIAGALAGLLAGIRPARRAARLGPLVAIGAQ